MIKNARVGISNYLLKQQQKKATRQVEVCNIHKAKKALIITNTSSEAGIHAFKTMKTFLVKHNINCEVIGYSGKKNSTDLIGDSEHHYLSNKDFTFFYLPKHPDLETILAKQFDLLINLCEEYSIQVENIAKLSKAKFKVGCSSFKTDLHDLSIEITETPTDPLFVTKQMQHYISIINS